MALDRSNAQLNEANRLISIGKFSRASSVLKQLLTAQPKHPEGRRLLASLHLKIGNLLAAKPAYETLVKEALEREDYKNAESLLREYLVSGPRYLPFIELLATTCEQKGDSIAAAIEYGKAIDLLLEDPDPERPNLPAELYGKVKQIAPSSQVVSRLAPQFEAPAEPSPPSSQPALPPQPASSSIPFEAPDQGLVPPSPPPEPTAPPPPVESVPPPPVQEPAPMTVAPPPSSVPSPSGLRLEPANTSSVPPSEEVAEEVPQVVIEEPVAEPDVPEPTAQSPVTVAPVQEELEPEVSAPEVQPDIPSAVETQEEEPVSSEVGTAGLEEPAEPPLETRFKEEALSLQPSSEPALSVDQGSAPIVEEEVEEDLVEEPATEIPQGKTRQKAPALPSPSGRRRKTRAQRRISGSAFITRWIQAGRAFSRWLGVGAIMALVLPILLLGGTVLAWLFTEEKPNAAFSSLRDAPPQSMVDYKRNGYFLLFGFGAGPLMDPVQAGYELWLGKEANSDSGCFDPTMETSTDIRFQGDRNALSEWYASPDPVAQFQFQAPTIASWIGPNNLLLNRYRRWFTMGFEDWGFGHPGNPQCAQILPTHRLFVAEGFAQGDIARGLAILEVDLTAWRAVLGYAKTLPLKVLAIEAVRDDAAILSGLLARPGLNPEILPDLMRLTRGLDQEQRSLRWPIQHEFAKEAKRTQTGRRKDEEGPRSLLIQVLQVMPVPAQKILNGHADYYQALVKATEENQGTLPRLYAFANTPPRTLLDYLVNPVDNILLVESKPHWEAYLGDIQELDVRLRLAGLQARVWTASDDKEVMARIAEAGSGFFDPFTGLPMLVNLPARVLYSVGRDGRDDNGDPSLDITAPLLVKRF